MSQELLNTAEAARFLRVTQASIRRWSDAGLLSSHRVGRRRERRFAESDLVEFLNRSQKQSVAAKPETAIHVGGVAIPVPGHLATFYSTDPGRMRLTVLSSPTACACASPVFWWLRTTSWRLT